MMSPLTESTLAPEPVLAPPPAAAPATKLAYLKYLLLGVYFGMILVKAEAISWVRMQEMFRMESFYFYGIFLTAVATAWLGVAAIRKFKLRSFTGEDVRLVASRYQRSNIYGGIVFGIGWGISGVCPGPIYASIGAGVSVMIVSLLAAVLGTYCYGLMRHRLPH